MPMEQEEIRVTVFIPNYRVEGIIYMYKGGRLSDFLNTTTKAFIPITNATIYSEDDNKALGRPRFMGLNRNSIIMLYKMEEEGAV